MERGVEQLHILYQPSSAGCVCVLLLIPPVAIHSPQYYCFCNECPLFEGFSPTSLTSKKMVSIYKRLTCNSHVQQCPRHGGTWADGDEYRPDVNLTVWLMQQSDVKGAFLLRDVLAWGTLWRPLVVGLRYNGVSQAKDSFTFCYSVCPCLGRWHQTTCV